eukprot:scaffold231879_cov13-Tisochrysis_lutea.AAC.1
MLYKSSPKGLTLAITHQFLELANAVPHVLRLQVLQANGHSPASPCLNASFCLKAAIYSRFRPQQLALCTQPLRMRTAFVCSP